LTARRRNDAGPPRPTLARLEKIVRGFARARLCVVGDVMLDEYLWGDVERVSPEAPVPVVHVRRESHALGGAGNVVRNVVAMGAHCSFCAVVGEDDAGRQIVELLEALGVDSAGVVRDPERPTTRKTRVEARAQQLLRYDRETEAPLTGGAQKRLVASVEAALTENGGVVFEDYAKGVLAGAVVRRVIRRCRELGVFVAVDPKDAVSPYRGASLVKPNLRELEAIAGVRVRSDADLERAVAKLQRKLDGAEVVVTRGAEGMSLFLSDAEPLHVRSAPFEVFDVQGAGDTAIAALALSRLAGGSLEEAAIIANAAAGIVVGKVGTATASPAEILAQLPRSLAAAAKGMR
jgi:D-beta-D-heptose 7-phosphate kinase/D-beta-D-heptose 1-phosphate adenosyltransferase